MNLRRLVTFSAGVIVLVISGIGFFMMQTSDSSITESVSVDDVLNLMATAHTRYEQIHVRYNANSSGENIQHEVWLDSPARAFRHEITGADGEQNITVSDGSLLYMDTGFNDETMTQVAMPVMDNVLFANQVLGGIGTFIAPINAIDGRLSQSQITLEEITVYENPNIAEPLRVAKLITDYTEFPPNELWIDLDTGIIVQEILYAENEEGISIYTLEILELNPQLDPVLFTIP
ncbi:MAG: hypothetical protein Phog2KO_43460 [Phototrophicaceae bacterium]